MSGGFVEIGGSVTVPAFGVNVALGFAYSQSLNKNEEYDEHIQLWTASVGASTSVGAEGHGYVGYAWTHELWRNY